MTMVKRNFPPDVEKFIHELCAKAIRRAIQNGTYKPLQQRSSEPKVAALK
jgi:hypothetical protein